MEQIGESIRQAQANRSEARKHFKQISLGLLSSALLVLNWWMLSESMFGGRQPSFWAYTAGVSAVWVAVVSIFALTRPDKFTFFIFNAIGLITYLVIMPRDIYVFIGGVIFFLLNLFFQGRVQGEETNQLNFSIRRTLGNSQIIITYAFLILLGFVVYSSVSEDFNRDRDQYYRKLGETAVSGVPLLAQDRSQYNLSQRMSEFFRKQAEQQYPEFNQVSASQQRELLDQIRQNFAEQFGVDADDNVTLRVALTEVATQRLREGFGRYEDFFPLFFTVLVLALMRTFAFVFNWVVLLLSWAIFKVLRIAGFIRIEKETVEVEKLAI